MIDYLDWDSQFFAYKIGRVKTPILREADLGELMDQKRIQGYDIVYLFAEQLEPEAEAELTKNKIFPFDRKIIFSKQVSAEKYQSEHIQLYKGPITDSLKELALLSGHKSRFKNDPRLNHRFRDLYELWINKSLNGSMADAVFVAGSDSTIEGFITLKEDGEKGHVGLIAVSPMSQGKGLGSKLMKAADFWCFRNRLKTCSVVTQLDNTGACMLYEKNGYEKERAQFVFHL